LVIASLGNKLAHAKISSFAGKRASAGQAVAVFVANAQTPQACTRPKEAPHGSMNAGDASRNCTWDALARDPIQEPPSLPTPATKVCGAR
jgi:hypothetical protein